MSKKSIQREIRRVKRLRTWQLLALLVLAGFVTAILLRLDNVGMIQRREAVIAADRAGDRELLERNVRELRRYVFSHMNASTRLYLTYQRERDAREILEAAANNMALDNPHGNIHRIVADICDPLAQRFGWGYSQPYFDCIARELANFPAMDDSIPTIEMPRRELYRISYVSPRWTLGPTGIMVLVCVVLVVMILVRAIRLIVLQVMLSKYRDPEA